MTFTSLFFTAKGRISRSQFWLGMLGVAAAFALAVGIAFMSEVFWIVVPVLLAGGVSTYLLAIKRLHDRNKTGWWTLVFLWAPGVLDRISDKVTEGGAMWWALVLAGLVISLWGLIELGFLRGSDDDND